MAGSVARLSIFLGVEQSGVSILAMDLVATSIVNLAGAGLLGIVHSKEFKFSQRAKAFWGSGFAGGFTTMSGLAVITASSELGLSGLGYFYWLTVGLQFVLGVLTYWLARHRFDLRKSSVS